MVDLQSKNEDQLEEKTDCKDNNLAEEFDYLNLDPTEVGKLKFRTPDEGDWFYWNYDRQNGFDIRRCHKKTIGGSLVKNIEWVCARAGFKVTPKCRPQRQRRSRKDTRCGCKARFRVAHDRNDDIYRVTDFEPTHNHPLETPESAHRLRCNRHLKPSEKNLLSGMASPGISPAKAMDYLEYIEGGARLVAWRRKDGYNYLHKKQMQMIRDGDVNTALSLLSGMKLHDENMIFEYTVDDNQALTRLFWADGISRAEYDLFGDVILFDSTYNTNTYHFPLVIMSGVNNHYNTCVFGASLLYNETIESYRWLLQKFREAMNGKMPISVLTDQDASMRAVIEIEFPFAKHRICSWHLERNALANVHIPGFASGMGQLLKKYSLEEFDSSWDSLITRYNVGNHPWVIDIFKKKELWGEAFFRGHFFGMMSTIGRSESINSLFKLCLKQKMKLTEFLKQYHFSLQKIRATFFKNQEECMKPTPSMDTNALSTLERHDVSVYTKKLFEMVSKEISKEQDLVVREATNDNDCIFSFKFGHYAKDNCKHFSVHIDWTDQRFQCECQKLESDGLPCRHLISAFKFLRLQEIPENCIVERWTKAIGKELQCNYPQAFPFEDEQRRGFAILSRECASLCLQSSQSESTTVKMVMHIRNLAKEVEEQNLISSQVEGATRRGNEPPIVRDLKRFKSFNDIRDPARIRSRGAKVKQQNC